ncbi:MAG: patatin-like phospholipase family protein [Gemmatimonadetes bacterium]|nr:patatin-like phospholipase family protein [Gemmatimonadota bacterium]
MVEHDADRRAKLAFALSGGGARAAYQTGVLCHIGRRMPDLRVPILTGVSAGGINLGFLASYRGSFREATQALRRRWLSLTTEEVFKTSPSSLVRGGLRVGASLFSGGTSIGPRFRSLVDTSPLREFVDRSVAMEGIEERLEAGELEAVGLTAISYQTGRTVLFVQGDAPVRTTPSSSHHRVVRAKLTVDHVMASAAIPLLFPAIKVGQQYYGDGSFRSTAPLGPATQLGADRIFAISARYRRSTAEARRPDSIGYPSPARVLGLLLNSVFLDTLDWDAAALRRINHLVDRLPPEARQKEGLRHIDLLIQRPSKDLGKLAAEFEVQLPRALRFLIRGLGSSNSKNADFLSYLLFESEYVRTLVELGEADAESNWDRIEPFMS